MKRLLAGLLLLALVGSGCANAADASGPPEIVYGRDLCEECGMLITEERFAAAYRIDGETRRFDDIGNMLLYGTKHGELPEAERQAWVHDYQTTIWVSAESAWYVLAPGLVTPMGWGLVAFSENDRAMALAAERDGEVYSWEQLFEFSLEPGRLVHNHDADHNGESP